MHDLVHNVKAVQCRETNGEGAAFSATVTGAVVDTLGFETICFLADVGHNTGNAFDGTNNITFKVQEGALANGTDMADIDSGDYIASERQDGSAWDRVLDASTDENQTYKVGVRTGTKRYRRLVATEAGTVTTVPVGFICLLGNPRHAPA